MKKLVLAASVAALAAAGNAGAATFKGVVLARQANGHVLVVATAGVGRTVRVASSAARPGSRVAVTASSRPNGTWSASRVRVVGRATHARVRGVIVRRAGSLTFLSAGRSVLVLHSRARRLASAADATAGTVANVGVNVSPTGQLTTTSVQPVGQTGSIVIQATVASVAPGQLTLTVNGQTLVVPLPAGTTLPSTLVAGSTVQLTLNFSSGQATGTNPKAEDDEDDQGDDNDDQGDDDQGDHSSGHQGGDDGDDDGGDD